MTVLDDAHALRDEVIALRRLLHSQPELGLDLPRTQQAVLAALDGLPLEITTGKDTTSVTAVLRGHAGSAAPGRPPVLLRADMDAVPVQEETDLPFASTVAGAASTASGRMSSNASSYSERVACPLITAISPPRMPTAMAAASVRQVLSACTSTVGGPSNPSANTSATRAACSTILLTVCDPVASTTATCSGCCSAAPAPPSGRSSAPRSCST